MKPAPALFFPPFRLDPLSEQLWREDTALPLRPKPFAILRYLVEHTGRLVTRQELLQAVWPGTYVSEGLLRGYIRELRVVLGDDAAAPRFIETVEGRGYRFIAPLATAPPVRSPEQSRVRSLKKPGLRTLDSGLRDSLLVGRETELERLHGWLDKAMSGERQVVFVTGEPGIGKTTLVDTFLAQVGAGPRACPPLGHPQGGAPTVIQPDIWIARGQCIEHYGAGEAYLPILEALGRLCRESGHERLIELLYQYAPTWLVQMPALLSDEEREALQRQVHGTTPERMLREMAEALEALTGVGAIHESPLLVLWLEDLHWSDVSTVDLLLYLARRRGPARLLIIGSYRPTEVSQRGHPLKGVSQELQGRGQGAELALRALTAGEVTQYLTERFPTPSYTPSPASAGEACPEPSRRSWGEGRLQASSLHHLGQVIHRHTEGNPLFMVTVVNDLVTQGGIGDGQACTILP